MNLKSNLLVAAALLAGGFGFTSAALAGEGGVAGSAAFQLTGGQVQRASVAVAVGKSTAYAGASTLDPTQTAAFATGTGGTVTPAGGAPYSLTSIASETTLNLLVGQGNQLDAQSININVPNGTALLTN